MKLVWFGILFLAFSWLRALHVFTEPSGYTAWTLVGTILLVIAFRNHHLWHEGMNRKAALAILIASILAIIWFEGPFQTGFVILAAASLISLLPFLRLSERWILPGLWCSGAVMVVQGTVVPFLYIFCSRYHKTAEIPFLHDLLPRFPSFPWLAVLLYIPLKILDPNISLSGSTLYLPTTLDTFAMTPTWEKLGLFPLSLMAAGMLLILLLQPAWRKRVWSLLLWLALYAYVRLLVLFLLVNHFRAAEAFWSFDYLFLSFLPLPVLLCAWWQMGISRRQENTEAADSQSSSFLRKIRNITEKVLRGSKEESSVFAGSFKFWRVLVGIVLFAGGLSAFWGFHDPGTRKEGRILIDERHSDWEWTTQPFDTTWYGGKSGYNYYCLADYWNHFYQVETRSDSLTYDFLSQWDVLVIKTPTSSFSLEEIDAIEKFVREGGGLFLIGDHTNVFGTSTYLNPIAERFGMYFRYDATYNLKNLGLNLYKRPHRFPHPVVRYMPNYLFATSCSFYSPLLSENVILGYGLRAMYLDYSERSYFPTKEGKMDYDFGLFIQTGGTKYGKGRVLGYTDSTCFSNFFMFIPGKPELALASIEWLNRRNHWAWLGPVFLLLALAGLVLLIYEGARNSGIHYWNTIIAVGTIAVIFTGWLGEKATSLAYPLPQPQRPMVQVAFDQEHGNYILPSERLVVNNWQNFQTFYVWTQRLGLIPRNENSLEKAVQNSEVLVEIHPYGHLKIEELDMILDFVQKGGTLIVFDSPANITSTANTLLGPFKMAFDLQRADSIAVLDAQGDTLGIAREAIGLVGSKPLLTLADDRVAMGYVEFGKGKVLACGASYIFSSEYMGSTAIVPDAAMKRIYRVEYDLFEKIAGLKARGRYHMDEK